LQTLVKKRIRLFLSLRKRYEVGYFEGIFCVNFSITDGEIKPLIITIGICIVLHKKNVGIRLFNTFESALKITALKFRLNYEIIFTIFFLFCYLFALPLSKSAIAEFAAIIGGL
jgi:hypothetical protein